jgi:crossover junction endodeoxyribonuclease RuvC
MAESKSDSAENGAISLQRAPIGALTKRHGSVRIIGIDPGLRRTGWGVIDCDGARLGFVACGSVVSDEEQGLGARLRQIFDGLSQVLAELAPIEAAIEQTFVNRDASATLKLGQARGIALLVPALAGLLIAEYAPNAVKKTVIGTGHGDKGQIRAMVRCLLPRASPDSSDAADALAIAITHAHSRSWRRLEAIAAAERALP